MKSTKKAHGKSQLHPCPAFLSLFQGHCALPAARRILKTCSTNASSQSKTLRSFHLSWRKFHTSHFILQLYLSYDSSSIMGSFLLQDLCICCSICLYHNYGSLPPCLWFCPHEALSDQPHPLQPCSTAPIYPCFVFLYNTSCSLTLLFVSLTRT